MKRPSVRFDDVRGVIMLNGVKYSYEFFNQLGLTGAPVGSALRIVKRDDGVLTVEKLQEKPS